MIENLLHETGFFQAVHLAQPGFAGAISSCWQKDNVAVQHPMPLLVPANFPVPEYNLAANPITREGFELGRKLFYDGRLSRDGSISCGNCHVQASAFTHHGHPVSHGIDDKVGTRNAPGILGKNSG